MSKKVVKLNVDDIKNIVNECVNELANSINDDLIEYCRLRPADTGLKVDIFIDDGGAYIRNNHPLCVYMQNDYNNVMNVLPIEVEPSSQLILNTPSNIGISLTDYQNVLRYINQNKTLIKRLADGEINHMDYINNHKKAVSSIGKNMISLNEMATLHTSESDLPTTLWIDEGTSPQHGPRIKFKANNEQTTTRDFTSMSISNNPQIFNLPKKCNLSARDIERIRKFVILNGDNLLAVARGEMSFFDFLQSMQKV